MMIHAKLHAWRHAHSLIPARLLPCLPTPLLAASLRSHSPSAPSHSNSLTLSLSLALCRWRTCVRATPPTHTRTARRRAWSSWRSCRHWYGRAGPACMHACIHTCAPDEPGEPPLTLQSTLQSPLTPHKTTPVSSLPCIVHRAVRFFFASLPKTPPYIHTSPPCSGITALQCAVPPNPNPSTETGPAAVCVQVLGHGQPSDKRLLEMLTGLLMNAVRRWRLAARARVLYCRLQRRAIDACTAACLPNAGSLHG